MLSSKRVLRVAGFCGVIAPIIVFALIALAIAYSPWFSWTGNALSDLGVPYKNTTMPAILFNSSLIIGGSLASIFAIGLREALPRRIPARMGASFCTLAAVALCAIGVFPETAGILHLYVSIGFFTLISISMLLTGAALLRDPPSRWKLGFPTVLTGVIAAVVWALPWESAAIPEMAAGLSASTWSTTLGIRMLKHTAKGLT